MWRAPWLKRKTIARPDALVGLEVAVISGEKAAQKERFTFEKQLAFPLGGPVGGEFVVGYGFPGPFCAGCSL
ncbi:hypothetical protein CEV32_0035 [Brucella rhizosphaerae]|uniref:Uncharacterized protein n=1 Tax=Brucella rhizosphaerae TaxID=571254 RepID=A0A256FGU5_9HYPH|nr:hypothetical protein CEV32_0035 [Brucella rhizosphaerae]